jgi:hypothetical protein
MQISDFVHQLVHEVASPQLLRVNPTLTAV